jgi:TetR/AcrR family transcriptional regulator, cholesterol catabolism regulator
VGRPPGRGPSFETRRQQIIDQAAALFAKRGYAATGISELSEHVGLGRGALYHYIGSKENLLIEIQDRVLQPLTASARAIVKLDADPVLRLRLLSEALLDMILARLDHIWVYEHDYRHLTGDNRKRLVRQRRDFENLVQKLLVEAIETGVFRPMDASLATLQFLNLHNHTYQWAKPGKPGWDARSLSREYCRTLLSGFGSPDRKADDVESRLDEFRTTGPYAQLMGLQTVAG